jgi:hypothetical protein
LDKKEKVEMKNTICFFLTCVLISVTGCSLGVNLPNNCGKEEKATFVVMPFIDDNFGCNIDVENKIRNLCYNVMDGRSVLNDFSSSNRVSVNEIAEFCDFADSKGIDYIVFGTCRVEWFEGDPPSMSTFSHTGRGSDTSRSNVALEYNMYLLVTGNYAVIDSYYVNTKTKKQHKLFQNYKVKKVPIGMPTLPVTSAF